MKRPYSTNYTARANSRRYLLSGIPPTLWAEAQRRARREHHVIRQVILSLVEDWLDSPDGQGQRRRKWDVAEERL